MGVFELPLVGVVGSSVPFLEWTFCLGSLYFCSAVIFYAVRLWLCLKYGGARRGRSLSDIPP